VFSGVCVCVGDGVSCCGVLVVVGSCGVVLWVCVLRECGVCVLRCLVCVLVLMVVCVWCVCCGG
jgi:hypothetical protein